MEKLLRYALYRSEGKLLVIAIATLIILILINAFFAGAELAFVHTNDTKIQQQAEQGNQKAVKLSRLLSKPSQFLSTIQIGITLAGFLSSAFAADFFAGPFAKMLYRAGIPLPENILHTLSLIVITVILSYFTLVFGELVPKQLALQKPEQISSIAVGPISLLEKIFSPLVKLLTLSTNAIVRLFGVDPNATDEEATEEDIRMLVDVGGEKGTINPAEKLMIHNIFEFNDTLVSEIITHRTDMSALSVDITFEKLIHQINQDKYTRYPVYEDNLDTIVGILHVKDLFNYVQTDKNKTFDLRKVMRKPYFILETQTIDVLFSQMQRHNIHIAIVIDEFGGTEGLITIEDVLEEIVGDISSEMNDPDLVEETFKQVSDNSYEIDGVFYLTALEELLNMDFPTDEYDTVSGFLINEIGYIPSVDERPVIKYKHLTFEVQEVADNRLEKIIVTVGDPE